MFGTSTRFGFRRGCSPASWRPPSDLVDQVHVSGALSGARTGKGPQMADPRPTPKPANWRPIRGWTKPVHEREMKADSMPERLLNGPGSPPSIDPVYPELSPPSEPRPSWLALIG